MHRKDNPRTTNNKQPDIIQWDSGHPAQMESHGTCPTIIRSCTATQGTEATLKYKSPKLATLHSHLPPKPQMFDRNWTVAGHKPKFLKIRTKTQMKTINTPNTQ